MNKDKVTTLLGLGISAMTAAQPVLNGVQGSFHQQDWMQLGGAVMMAIFGFFTNKGQA